MRGVTFLSLHGLVGLVATFVLCGTLKAAEEPQASPAPPASSSVPEVPPTELKQTEVLAAGEALDARRREVEERTQAETKELVGIRTTLERFQREAAQREAEDA